MSAISTLQVSFDLDSLDELFNALPADPFSERKLAILGEAGIDHLEKILLEKWPRFPGAVQCTLRLPAEQIEPGLQARAQNAFQRYCAEQAASHRLTQRNILHSAWGQLGMAFGLFILAIGAFYLGFVNPPGFLPPYLGQILAFLIVLAGGVAVFGALWTLMFDWIPSYQEARTFERLAHTRLILEPLS